MPSPERVSWARFRVASVALVSLLILSVLVYLLTGGSLFQPKATLYIYIPDATGVAPRSPVRVNGIDVGAVTGVNFSGSGDLQRSIRVAFRVEQQYLREIPADSTAQISSDTLVGDKFLDISSGTSPRPVGPNSEISYQTQALSTKTLDLQDFRKRLDEMNAILDDIESGKSRVGQFVIGEDMYNSWRRALADMQGALNRAGNTTRQMGALLYSDQLHQQIETPLRTLDRTLIAIQAGQGGMGQMLASDAAYQQLRTTTDSLKRAIAGVHSGSWIQSDEAYEKWSRGLGGLIQSVDDFAVNPALLNSQQYDTLNGFARELGNNLKDFRENPSKYMRLQLF
jgi:phospholipid/cholesterol/gamma-HCH transport system substrate-binding protein